MTLQRRLLEVGAVTPPPDGLGPRVRGQVRARRQLTAAAVGLAVLVAGGGAVAIASATGGHRRDPVAALPPRAAATVPPSPREVAPSPGPTRTARATPTRTPSPVPTRTAAPTPSASARPTPTPTPAATPAGYAPPGATITVTGTPGDNHAVSVSVVVRDTDGYLLGGSVDFGDGTQVDLAPAERTCGSSSGSAPEPSSVRRVFTHVYDGPGAYTIVATATTGSTCRPTPQEHVTGYGNVNVP